MTTEITEAGRVTGDNRQRHSNKLDNLGGIKMFLQTAHQGWVVNKQNLNRLLTR